MRAPTVITAALSLALLSTEVAATLPACMLACLEKVGRQSSQCTSLNQIPCFCTNEVAAMKECFDAICPNNNAGAAYQAFEAACSDMNIRLDASSISTSESSTTTSASTTSESSSTSESTTSESSTSKSSSSVTTTSSTTSSEERRTATTSSSSSSSSSTEKQEVKEATTTTTSSSSIHYQHTLEAYTGAANANFVQYVHKWLGAAVAALFI